MGKTRKNIQENGSMVPKEASVPVVESSPESEDNNVPLADLLRRGPSRKKELMNENSQNR
jgi:hypothetical protein